MFRTRQPVLSHVDANMTISHRSLRISIGRLLRSGYNSKFSYKLIKHWMEWHQPIWRKWFHDTNQKGRFVLPLHIFWSKNLLNFFRMENEHSLYPHLSYGIRCQLTLKWQYDQIFSLRFYIPNITYYASKNEFAKRFLEETGPH